MDIWRQITARPMQGVKLRSDLQEFCNRTFTSFQCNTEFDGPLSLSRNTIDEGDGPMTSTPKKNKSNYIASVHARCMAVNCMCVCEGDILYAVTMTFALSIVI